MTVTVLALGILIFLAHLFAIVFQRTKVPDVLLLMLLGLLLGPVLGIVNPRDLGRVGEVLSGVALVVILFESGTTIELKVLGRSLRPTLRLTLITFLVTMAVFTVAGNLVLRLPPLGSLLLGATLAGTSSAVVIPMVRGLALSEKAGTVLVLESALTDVLCIVAVFAFLAAAQQGSIDPGRLLGGVLASLLFAALIGMACGVAWMRALPLIRRLPNTLIATVAVVCIVYGVTELLGFSGAIASLAFGVTLTNHEQMGFIGRLAKRGGDEVPVTLQPHERAFFSEVVFVLKTLFFVYLGLSVRFGEWDIVAFALATTGFVYFARPYLAARTVDRDYSLRDASITGIMVPKGLAAAVLAGLPLQAGIAGGAEIRDVAYSVVLVSIVMTAGLGWATDREPLRGYFARVFRRLPAVAALRALPGPAPVPLAAEGPPVELPPAGEDEARHDET